MNAPEVLAAPDRSKFIGGSDVAAILGLSPWKTPFQLWQEKSGLYTEDVSPAKQKIFNRGKRWEPVVVEMLVDELQDRGHDVQVIARNERYQDPEHLFMACELDLELRIDGEEMNGEMKTVHPFAAKDWGEEDSDEIPVYYAAQVMHGLMIKPRRRAIVAALIGADDLRIHFVERDDETIAAMRQHEVAFWDRVLNETPPEVTSAEDVRRLFLRDNGTAIECDSAVLEAVQRLKDVKAAVKQMESEEEMLATRVKLAIGDASTLTFMGQPLATWKSQTTRRIDTKALEAAHPAIAEEFRKASESRVLRLK